MSKELYTTALKVGERDKRNPEYLGDYFDYDVATHPFHILRSGDYHSKARSNWPRFVASAGAVVADISFTNQDLSSYWLLLNTCV